MNKRIVVYVIAFQVLIVGLLLPKVLQKQILGISVDNIDGKEIVATPSAKYKFFYEPLPSSNDPGTQFVGTTGGHLVNKAGYTINGDALNERFQYKSDKDPGTFRIITLGSSFTFGLGVDTKDNWTELLEDKLNELKCNNIKKFEVINLGYRGYDSDYVVERFRRRGIKYSPDLIIWLHSPFLVPVEQTRSIAELSYRNVKKSKTLTSEEKTKILLEANKNARDQIVSEMGWDGIIQSQSASIKELKNYYSGAVMMVVIPDLPDKQKEALEKVSNSVSNWSYLDTLRKIDKLSDGHPSKQGHKTITADIFAILQNKLDPTCN